MARAFASKPCDGALLEKIIKPSLSINSENLDETLPASNFLLKQML